MTESNFPFDVTPPERPAVVGEPVLIEDATTFSAPVEVVQRGKGMRAGLAGALLLVSGAGGFAVNSALAGPSGPETPEAAMEELFAAMAEEDIVGMLETLLPSERESYVDPTLELMEQLERLEVFGEAIEIDSFGTIDIQIEGLQVVSEPLADGFARVRTTAGTAYVDGQPADIPIFKSIAEMAGEPLEDVEPDEPSDLGEDGFDLVAVEYDGSWYLSLAYSMAEEMRGDLALPAFGAGPTPVGGATPGEAVENLIQAGIEFDLEAMLTQLDPEEMRALYDYSPLFLPDAQEGIDGLLAEIGAENFDLIASGFVFSSEERRGRTVVFLDEAHFGGSFDGESVSYDIKGECYVMKITTWDGAIEEFDSCDLDAQDEVMADLQETFGLDPDLLDFGIDDVEFERSGITVVERDGRWYVSVVPTVMYSMVDVLAVLEPSHIDSIKDGYSEIFSIFGDEFFSSDGDSFTVVEESFIYDEETGTFTFED